ncbi:hypothetical protein M378DRAFT_82955 [Amanita muscaria Koide BX008]|uniref:Protein kinase domain-containing protein n=1 Tax=Amanita muscaria (strain Koide BX008) TaxID=946122 RepID=A0A0C2WHX9_AMAMK|nr:hypothetical protein M378DRAFT_82955 [Amanita muscaria Koide BX008]
MASTASVLPSAHPPLGTLIDDGAYELVDTLGVGGYGVVYRAVDPRTPYSQSYAVKCLIHSPTQSQSRRNYHIREIALHRIASGHPGVVTLHKVIQDYDYTYIIMDYAPDHDLFTQILNNRRYLGDDIIIKHIFLQLLDAVEYIHSLGIYHRDLKPENILCFEDGYRIALTDFGLATTDKTSSEFRTGSVYHMSPECQGGEFSPTGVYSPRFNDIWSLGIILLNLATGRNPWKSATSSDPTFQAYLRDPYDFLPSVLPISSQVNDILIRVLAVDWRKRMSLRQLRRAIENVDSFYSDGVVFEGSLARCPWEVGLEFDFDTRDQLNGKAHRRRAVSEELRSCWSEDTDDESDNALTGTTVTHDLLYAAPWSLTAEQPKSDGPTWLAESLGLSDDLDPYSYDGQAPSITHSPTSPSFSDGSSAPVTPDSATQVFGVIERKPASRYKLTINTALDARPRYYESNYLDSPETPDEESLVSSPTSSTMHTAIEFVSYPPSFVFASSTGSSVSLQETGSLLLNETVEEDLKGVGPALPWNHSSAASSADLSVLSQYPLTEESYQSVTAPRSYDMPVGRPIAAPHDYTFWPGFCNGSGHDGGGGRSVEESCAHGVAQESLDVCPDDSAHLRTGSGMASSTTPQPRYLHTRRTSEPWLSDLFRFAKQPRQQAYHGDGPQHDLGYDCHLSQDSRTKSHHRSSKHSKLPECTFQFDGQDHRRATPKRHTRPWFLPSRFFHVG